MSVELLYTSAPKGLKQGSRGFCTVLSTAGTPVNLAMRLESLSGYRHLFATDSPQADQNPVAYSHLKFTLAGQPTSVVSRVAAYGADYSGRTNKLAHHIVVDASERPAAGPAWLLQQPGLMRNQWDSQCATPGTGPSIPVGDQQPALCETWQRITGDAGWGGVVADALGSRGGKPTWIIYKIDQQDELLALLNEAIALLPTNERWNATFSTYAAQLPPDVDCKVRCVVEGTEEARFAAARGNVFELNAKELTQPATDFVKLARGESIVSESANTQRDDSGELKHVSASTPSANFGLPAEVESSPGYPTVPPPVTSRSHAIEKPRLGMEAPPVLPSSTVNSRLTKRRLILGAAMVSALAAGIAVVIFVWPGLSRDLTAFKAQKLSETSEVEGFPNKIAVNTKPDKPQPDNKESGNKEPDSKEPDNKESGNKEPDSKEPDSKEADNKESGSKEPDNKESGNKEPGNKEPGNKEPGNKEPGNKEPGNKEPDSKEPDSKEPDSKEPDSKEPDSKESDSKEPDSKEPDSKEPDSKEPDSKESDSKESDSNSASNTELVIESRQLSFESMLSGSPSVFLVIKDERLRKIDRSVAEWSGTESSAVASRTQIKQSVDCKWIPSNLRQSNTMKCDEIMADTTNHYTIAAAVSVPDAVMIVNIKTKNNPPVPMAQKALSLSENEDKVNLLVSNASRSKSWGSKGHQLQKFIPLCVSKLRENKYPDAANELRGTGNQLINALNEWNDESESLDRRITKVSITLHKCREKTEALRKVIKNSPENKPGLKQEMMTLVDRLESTRADIESALKSLQQSVSSCKNTSYTVDTGRKLHLFPDDGSTQRTDAKPSLVFPVKFTVEVTAPQ